ncbi:MAG: ABC transporter permease [Anaerolineae bacterium]|nr:ABC transporter permease [Anaerolineae bacterium]
MKAAIFVLVAMAAFVILGPLLASADPLQTDPPSQLQPPSLEHVLGTDLLGRDVFSRVVHSGRHTLAVAGFATGVAAGFGLPLGILAGLWRRDFDLVLIQALLAIPSLVVALVVLTLMGRGVVPVMMALGLAQIAPFAYTIRSSIRALETEGYVDAALSLGATRFYILIHHILPGAFPTSLAYLGVVFSYAILNGAALSFLGLGNEPGTPDWGVILAEGRSAFRSAPWIGFAPGLAITVTVWAVNRLSDQIVGRNRPAQIRL